jgi:hypothetical protein
MASFAATLQDTIRDAPSPPESVSYNFAGSGGQCMQDDGCLYCGLDKKCAACVYGMDDVVLPGDRSLNEEMRLRRFNKNLKSSATIDLDKNCKFKRILTDQACIDLCEAPAEDIRPVKQLRRMNQKFFDDVDNDKQAQNS